MKKITYEQNGIKHEVMPAVQTFGPSLVWDLMGLVKVKEQKEILEQIHGLLTAMYYGKVTIQEIEK